MAKIAIYPSKSTGKEATPRTFTAVLENDQGQTEGLPEESGAVQWSFRLLERRDGDVPDKGFQLLPKGSFKATEKNQSNIRVDITKLEGRKFELKAMLEGVGESNVAEVSTTDLDTPVNATGGAIADNAKKGVPDAEGGKELHPHHEHSVHLHLPPGDGIPVRLTRAEHGSTSDEVLWIAIRTSTNQLRYNEYETFVDQVFSHSMPGLQDHYQSEMDRVAANRRIPSHHVWIGSSFGQYPVLRKATEVFVMTRCGILPASDRSSDTIEIKVAKYGHLMPLTLARRWAEYEKDAGLSRGPQDEALPYLDLIRRKLGDIACPNDENCSFVADQLGLLQEKLVFPCMLELIWSYWHEEGMLVQAMNAITQRFQNVRAPGVDRDPLAQLELDPLRRLNQLMWGYVQDESNRLSVLRRAHEYDHHYGFSLHGKATADMRTVDRRSKFLESFHNLLLECHKFFEQDDNTTLVGDAFPVLNAIKETHYLLSHGAHNQFGDMPATARQEMLIQQYLLSRPEMREFLGGRVMVPYPEKWMDRVDAVKKLKGWTDTSVIHFRDLATFGEQILLSIRFGAWSIVDDPKPAANWVRYWRAEIQGYMHAYRAVTGVDLTADVVDQRRAGDRFLSPSVHLRNRLLAQAAK